MGAGDQLEGVARMWLTMGQKVGPLVKINVADAATRILLPAVEEIHRLRARIRELEKPEND